MAALDRLAQGVMVVDAEGRPLFVNQTADTILPEQTELQATPMGSCALPGKRDGWNTAHDAGASNRWGQAAVRFKSNTVVAPYALLVHATHDVSMVHAAAVGGLSLFGTQHASPVPEHYLRQLHGLTRAEAAVTMEITRGQDGPMPTRRRTLARQQRVLFRNVSSKRPRPIVKHELIRDGHSCACIGTVGGTIGCKRTLEAPRRRRSARSPRCA